MNHLQPFIDAFFSGDTLFRFVYKPATNELFLEDELEQSDNGQFVYVPCKNAQQLLMEMSYFADEQVEAVQQILYDALMSPSPLEQFEKVITTMPILDDWIRRKQAYAKRELLHWIVEYSLPIEG